MSKAMVAPIHESIFVTPLRNRGGSAPWRRHPPSFYISLSLSLSLSPLWIGSGAELSYVCEDLRTLKVFFWLTEKQTYLHMPPDKELKIAKL